LRRVARYVALLKLATERGHADRAQLRRLLTPEAYAQQFHPDVSTFVGAPLPTPADLGGSFISVANDRRALIAVAARQTAQEWGALAIDLRITRKGRLMVADLLRVQDRHLSTSRPLPPVLQRREELQREVRDLLGTRRAARDGAARAATLRVGDRGGQRTARTLSASDPWISTLRRVDSELDSLVRRLSPDAGELPAQLLGPEPSGGTAWDRWREDYLELRDYQGCRLRRLAPHPARSAPAPPAPASGPNLPGL
jgi:hypothetical protein